MNFLQQKSSGGTQVSGLLAHVTVVKVWGSGVSSASGMLNMCLTCQLLWMTVNAWLPQWYTYFFYPSHSSTNSTTSLWPRRYQLGSKVKKDTYIYLDFIWWAHFYGSLRGKKAVIWQHVRVSSPITRRDICQSGNCVDQFINHGCSRWTGICQLSGVQTVCFLRIHLHSGLCLLIGKLASPKASARAACYVSH